MPRSTDKLTPDQLIDREVFEFQVLALKLKHFKASEFLVGVNRARRGVANTLPPKEMMSNIFPVMIILDALRKELGSPVHLSSVYRAPQYNAKFKNSAERSQHQDFRAADFQCPGVPVAKVAEILKSFAGRPFACPLPINLHQENAPLKAKGLKINTTAQGTAFVFHGGIKAYQNTRHPFVHVDCRGYDANW